MIARTDTPYFRVALTVALFWLIGASGWAYINDNFMRSVHRAARATYEDSCRDSILAGDHFARKLNKNYRLDEDKVSYCAITRSIMRSDYERFVEGGGFWKAFLIFVLPPLGVILGAAYFTSVRIATETAFFRYLGWVRGTGRSTKSG